MSGTSEQTLAVVQAGAVGPLVELMLSDDDNLAEQASWAVANVLGGIFEFVVLGRLGLWFISPIRSPKKNIIFSIFQN